MDNIFIIAAAGTAIGFVMGLTGAGGGILAVPLLVLLFNVPVHVAAPVALLAIAVAASAAAAIGLHRGNLRWRAALLMAAAGLLTAPLGLWVARHVPAPPLQGLFGLLMMATSTLHLRGLLRGPESGHTPDATAHHDASTHGPPCRVNPNIGRIVWTNPCARALAASGAVAGFMAGLLGVGGGFVLIPALKRYTDLNSTSVITTSLGVLAIVSAGSAGMAAAGGQIAAALAIPFAAGTLVGLVAGRLIEPRLPGARVSFMFQSLALSIGVTLVVKAAGQLLS